MGRRDAAQVVLEVVAECRRLLPALRVTYNDNWMTLGNGTQANYDFGTVHHTATPSSAARPFPTETMLEVGRSDLRGPLCNFAGPWCTPEAPRLHVMAAFPANHAGASRASGPIPALSLFNPRTLGLEIDYSGLTAMSAGQLLVALVWTRAVANVLAKGNVEVVRAHFETSVTGKWDPGFASGKSYNMADWRRSAAALTPAPEDDMPYTPSDLENIDYRAATNVFLDLASGASPASDDFAGYIAAIVKPLVSAPPQPAVSVDAMSIAAAMAKDDGFLDALAERTAAKLAARLQA